MYPSHIASLWRTTRMEPQTSGPIVGIALALPASLALWVVVVEAVRLFV